MRDYTRKAKIKDRNEWVIGYHVYVDYLDKHYILVSEKTHDGFSGMLAMKQYEVDGDTICNPTGFTDKNGNKIWDNDIIQYIDGELSVNGVVRFGRHEQIVMLELGFYVEWVSDEAISFKTDFCYWVEKRDIEVIGNIFDNACIDEILGDKE